jgi:23S rRNA (cytosine1962-C5)-methyltransferase
MNPTVTLKPGKEYPIKAGHPWIFSNAIQKELACEPGGLVRVESSNGLPLGTGMINPQNSIRVRMISRDADTPIDVDFLVERFKALDASKKIHLPPRTNGYRVCHSDADGLPGLIVDRYAETLVFQVTTAGMERLKDKVVEALMKALKPKALVERSDGDTRSAENLKSLPPKVWHGKVEEPIVFLENGLKFLADTLKGQKTGFFFDQRDARMKVRELARNRHVLNLFGYSGAFSVYAAQGGAATVTTVDVSGAALDLARKNLELNGFDPADETRFKFVEADVFDLFKTKSFKEPADLIVCDPPAFAKSEKHVAQALEAYQSLNQRCLWMLQEGGILVSSSCSGRVTAEDFRKVLKMAAGHTGRDVRLLGFLGQAFDHTEKLAFPEGRYLKTAILEVIKAAKESK